MRSSNPSAPNRGLWPSDMQINIDGHQAPVLMLLFLRKAWAIRTGLDLPALSDVPDTGGSKRPGMLDEPLIEKRWNHMWLAAWSRDAATAFRAPGTRDLTAAHPQPLDSGFYTARYGTEGIDMVAFHRWEARVMAAANEQMEHIPQHKVVQPVLVAAWERGLQDISLLPFTGEYMHRLSDHHLVTSIESFEDPEGFARVLAQWIRTPL